jgi:hypothetical protein
VPTHPEIWPRAPRRGTARTRVSCQSRASTLHTRKCVRTYAEADRQEAEIDRARLGAASMGPGTRSRDDRPSRSCPASPWGPGARASTPPAEATTARSRRAIPTPPRLRATAANRRTGDVWENRSALRPPVSALPAAGCAEWRLTWSTVRLLACGVMRRRDVKLPPSAVVTRTGLSADTLRFYERRGLLPSLARTSGG